MTKQLHVNRKGISIAFCSLLLLSTVALALNIKSGSQRLQDSSRKVENEVIKQIDESPDQLLTVAGNNDCPLKITEARVKEVPGHLFTKLTGRATDLATISSVPEVTLVNTSGQTVTRFFLAIRDPKSQTTRGLVQSDIAIKPGESYVVKRENFAGSEKLTAADDRGQVRPIVVEPGLNSEKRWIQFAALPDLFVTIAKVEFESGGSWIIKEGEVK